MKDILDPIGQWVGVAPLALRSNNKRPVAIDDTLNVIRDSGAVTVDVLANDFDPEGAALTLVSASAALGSASVGPGSVVTYTPPPGLTGNDTVVYEIEDDLGQTRSGQVNVTISEPQLSVAVTAGNTIVVNAETGVIDIVVTEPAAFAGTYQADTADLAGGPVNLVPPAISGVASEGSLLSASEGLWIHDTGAGMPVQIWQWFRGGTAIAGADGATYTLTADDMGQSVTVSETLSDANGQRSVESPAVGMPFAPGDDTLLIGWWDAGDTGTITDTTGAVSAWADKAGGGALVQSSGARQPVTGTRQLNGRNVLDFTGNAYLEAARALPASGDVAFHAVLIIDAVTNAFEAALSVEATNDFQLDANAAAAFDGRLNATGIGTATPLSGGPFSGAILLSLIFDRTGTATAEVFLDGQSRGAMTYTAPIDPGVALHLMTNRSRNAWLDGAVAEVIITGSIDNRALHHAYLANKWGLG